MKCDYGCNLDYNFVLKNGKKCCSSIPAKCPQIRNKASNNTKRLQKEGRIKIFTSDDIKRSHKTQDLKYQNLPFEKQSYERRRKSVLEDQENKCLWCNLSEWRGIPLKLDIDHIDGNNQNNKRGNLRALCPNCHSQTNTFRGKNKNTGKIKVTDKELVEALSEEQNIHRALIKVGLSPKGKNYQRVKNLNIS
jgi:hypothetical protein